MKQINSLRILILLCSFLWMGTALAQMCSEPTVSGTTYTTIADGNWSNPEIWAEGSAPSFNIGANNKVVILNKVDRNTGGDFYPALNSVLIIKDGGELTTEQIQMEKAAQIIINYGKLHVDHGNFQVKNSAATICTFQACIEIDENFQFEESGTNLTFNYTGIQINNGNLQSKAKVTGEDIRIWLKNGNLERNAGTWSASTITHRRVSGSVVGFSGIVAQSTAAAIAEQITPCLDVPLPVRLISFEAAVKEKAILISWTTTGESHNRGFEVQRSADGNEWQTINFIASKSSNNSNGRFDYDYWDNYPLMGQNLYRLKQIDDDGTFTYSDVTAVNFHTDSHNILFPNPAKDNVTISGLQGTEQICIYDISGRLLLQTRASKNQTTINLANISSTVCFVRISKSDGTAAVYKLFMNK
jgi:hypothetical protein